MGVPGICDDDSFEAYQHYWVFPSEDTPESKGHLRVLWKLSLDPQYRIAGSRLSLSYADPGVRLIVFTTGQAACCVMDQWHLNAVPVMTDHAVDAEVIAKGCLNYIPTRTVSTPSNAGPLEDLSTAATPSETESEQFAFVPGLGYRVYDDIVRDSHTVESLSYTTIYVKTHRWVKTGLSREANMYKNCRTLRPIPSVLGRNVLTHMGMETADCVRLCPACKVAKDDKKWGDILFDPVCTACLC